MKQIKLLFFISCLVVLSACNSTLKSRNLDDYYAGVGIQKYFLTDVPDWASYSQAMGCFRENGIKYFDISALMQSYSLTYNKALQIQGHYNQEYLVFRQDPNKKITLKEEELLFFKASDQVNSGIDFFVAPDFHTIHLISLDDVLGDEKKINKLKNFLSSSVHDSGMPIIISSCLTKGAAEKILDTQGTKIISAEMLSIYNEAGARIPNMHIALGSFFKKNQRLRLYLQNKNIRPQDFQGNFEIRYY
jgi:hypothetical protein